MSAGRTGPARTGRSLLADAFRSVMVQPAVRWPPMTTGPRKAALSLLMLVAVPLAAQTGSDADVLARIRDEANSRSQILRSVHFLADVYGPRLTGSPSLKA